MIAKAQTAAPSQMERLLLLLPAASALLFGLGPFVLGGSFGAALGASGNDSFLYRCAGAATLGYAVGLLLGLRQPGWSALRIPMTGTLAFNLAWVLACLLEIVSGQGTSLVYGIALLALAASGICATLLSRHAGEPRPAPDTSPLLGYGLILGGVLATVFGLLPLLVPAQFSQLVGYKGTDVFFIRQAGAASLGYGVMAFWGLKSRAWKEIRISTVMALVFNGLGFVASVIALFAKDPIFIVGLIGAASLLYTILITISFQRKGQV